MADITLADLRTELRAMVGDSYRLDPADGVTVLQGPSVFTDTQVDAALNFAQRQYAILTGCTYANTSIAAGASFPTTSFGAHTVTHVDIAGAVLDRSSMQFEDRVSATWKTDAGTPKRWLVSGNQILVSPGGTTPTLTVRHLAVPGDITSAFDANIPEPHRRLLVYAGASHLLAQAGPRKDIQKSAAAMNAFVSYVTGRAEPPPAGG